MKCPNCGETKVAWQKDLWGAGQPQFWSKKRKVAFICGGKYDYDEENNTYVMLNPCGRKK